MNPEIDQFLVILGIRGRSVILTRALSIINVQFMKLTQERTVIFLSFHAS